MFCLFTDRSFSLGRTATRMSALAVIRTQRRIKVKPSTWKEEEVELELEEECSKIEERKRLNHRLHTTTNKKNTRF